jgi:hypothetical protein
MQPQSVLDTTPSRRTAPRIAAWTAGVLAAVILISLLIGLARTRRPWNDEAMFADPALNLAEKGFMGTTVLESARVLPHIDRYTYWIFPLNLITLAGWYKLAGFSLMSTRVLSMLWTFMALAEIYYLMRKWSANPATASLAVLITAFEYNILTAAAFGRYEPMVAALGFGAYCAYLGLREKHFGWAVFASNTLVMLCGMTHPNGLMFLFGLVFLVLYHDRKRLRIAHAAIAAAPYLIGASFWGAYIAHDPQSAIAQLRSNASHRVVLFHPLYAIGGEIERYLYAAGFLAHSAGHSGPIFLKSLALAIYLCAGVFALVNSELRRRPGYRILLWLTGLHLAYQCFFEGTKFTYYLFHIFPLYACILAIAVQYLWRRNRSFMRPVAAMAVAVVIGIGIGGALMRIRLNTYDNMYAPAVRYMQRHAGPSDLIMASCDFGFAYGFRPNLLDDIRLGYFSGKVPAYIVVEEIYQGNFDNWKAGSPGLYRFVEQRLSEYELVYNRNSYRIYRRKDSRL